MSEHFEVGACKVREPAGDTADALSMATLDGVSGGDKNSASGGSKGNASGVFFLNFQFKLVAVKTIS